MKCKKTSERLNAYLDGELAPDEALAVQAHLRACPRCAAELDGLKQLNQALGAEPSTAVPNGFARRVRAVAEERHAVPVGLAASTARLHLVLSRIAAVVTLAAGLWVGGLMAGSTSQSSLSVEPETYEVTEFDLQLDPLSATPPGSVAEVYLAFADQGE